MAAARQEKAIATKLKQIQALPANKRCADCGDEGNRAVRFASVKLGVFVCNQCYAAHRQLGAHITRGKVIGMDNFTAADVELLERIGNERANGQYEATLPAGAKPPPTPCNGCSGCGDCRQRLEYITDKYERRKWYSDSCTAVAKPPPRTCAAAMPTPAAPAAVQSQDTPHTGDSSSWAFFDAVPAPAPQDVLSFFASPSQADTTLPPAASSDVAFMVADSSTTSKRQTHGHSQMGHHHQPAAAAATGAQLRMFGQQPQQPHASLSFQMKPAQLNHTRRLGSFGQQHQQPQQQRPRPNLLGFQAPPSVPVVANAESQPPQQQFDYLPQPQPQPQPQPAGRAMASGPIDPSLFFQ